MITPRFGGVRGTAGRAAPAVAAPRWTLGSLAGAATLTAGLFLALPYAERLSQAPVPAHTVRLVDTTRLPPPAAIPRPAAPRPPDAQTAGPAFRPVLAAPKPAPIPVTLSMNLDIALNDAGRGGEVSFSIADSGAVSPVRNMVFEVADADEPPQPLVQIDPIYPPHARVRRIEGVVVLEFVVDERGGVRDIEAIASTPDDAFARASREAAARWRFSPARRNGQAVAVRVRQTVRFRVE